MRILHINSYYFTNKIHFNFRKHIAVKLPKSSYFIPVYKRGRKSYDDHEIKYYEIYSWIDKHVFFSKIIKSTILLLRLGLVKKHELIHCHTLFSDGMIGYFISIITNKPYLVSVRNTDVNVYLRKYIFRLIGRFILKRSSSVMFLSPAYESKILAIFPSLESKYRFVLPSGLDSFWLENRAVGPKHRQHTSKEVKLLFVGRLEENKNLALLLEFLMTYRDYSYTLNVIGENVSGYDFSSLNRRLRNKGKNSIKYLGKMGKQDLLNYYHESDIFILLSFKESFGISYIEALSQGTPVIYTRGQGIDGLFTDERVGFSCDPRNSEELKEKIDLILSNYNELSKNALESVKRFNWNLIIDEYESHIRRVKNHEVSCKK